MTLTSLKLQQAVAPIFGAILVSTLFISAAVGPVPIV
jgi:hypothetical protein